MLKKLLWLLHIVSLPASAFAADFGPTQKLDAQHILRGRFIQTHQRRLPNKPVRSEGRFVVAPKLGLIFAYEKPIPLTLIVTPTNMVQSIGGMTLASQTIINEQFFNRLPGMMIYALSGDFNNLGKYFEISKDQDKTTSKWRVHMTPKGPECGSNLFKSISASGDKFVDQAEVQRLDNLYDFFIFHDQTIGDDALTSDELADFRKTLPKATH